MSPGIVALLTSPAAQRVGYALLHFLWQGVVVAAFLALLLQLMQRKSANARYLVACAALALLALLPLLTAAVISPTAAPISIPPAQTVAAIPAPQTPPPTPITSVITPESASPPGFSPAPMHLPATPPPAPPHWLQMQLPALLPYAVAGWAIGVALLSLYHTLGWILVLRLRRLATPFTNPALLAIFHRLKSRLAIRVPVQLLQSACLQTPIVIGFLRPAILLPPSLLTGLSPDQLEAILAHELAHIRRYDALVRLLQALLETLLFFHPAVWWISQKITQESELCCDDCALEITHSPHAYARALAQLAGAFNPPLAPAASAGKLLPRLRHILKISPQSSPRKTLLSVALALIILTTILLAASCISQRPAPQSHADALPPRARNSQSQPAGNVPIPLPLPHLDSAPFDSAQPGLCTLSQDDRIDPPPSRTTLSATSPLPLFYDRALKGAIAQGSSEFVARLPDQYQPLKIMQFTRTGNEFKILLAIGPMHAIDYMPKNSYSYYVWSVLPPNLPAGRYRINLMASEYQEKDGQPTLTPKAVSGFYQLETYFTVDQTPAQDAAWKTQSQAGIETMQRITDQLKFLETDFPKSNPQDHPRLFHYDKRTAAGDVTHSQTQFMVNWSLPRPPNASHILLSVVAFRHADARNFTPVNGPVTWDGKSTQRLYSFGNNPFDWKFEITVESNESEIVRRVNTLIDHELTRLASVLQSPSVTPASAKPTDPHALTSAQVTFQFDESTHALLPPQTPFEITDPKELATLAAFFPQMEQGKRSPIAAGWIPDATIVFQKAGGATHTVTVSTTDDAILWSEGKGDWTTQRGLKTYLEHLRKTQPTDTDYQTLIQTTFQKIIALEKTHPALKGITAPEKIDLAKDPTLRFSYHAKVVREHPDQPTLMTGNPEHTEFGKEGFEFQLTFLKDISRIQAAFIPVDFGDLKLWFTAGRAPDDKVMLDIELILLEQQEAFAKAHHLHVNHWIVDRAKLPAVPAHSPHPSP